MEAYLAEHEHFLADLWHAGAGALAALVVMSGKYIVEHWRDSQLAKRQKNLMKEMLKDKRFDGWRRLETLAHVVGADEFTAKRLLLEIGARASENGKPIWALISRHPLPSPKTLRKAEPLPQTASGASIPGCARGSSPTSTTTLRDY